MRPLLGLGLLVVLATNARADSKTIAAVPGPAGEVDDSAYPQVENPRDYRDQHVAVGVTLGLATPYGEAGVELTWRPAPFFEISAGAGIALDGPQVAAMPRFIMRGETVSGFLGAGLSAGHWAADPIGFCISPNCNADAPTPVSADLLWANGEAGLEIGKRQMFARTTLGAGRVIAERNVEGETSLPTWLPYGSVTIGRRF